MEGNGKKRTAYDRRRRKENSESLNNYIPLLILQCRFSSLSLDFKLEKVYTNTTKYNKNIRIELKHDIISKLKQVGLYFIIFIVYVILGAILLYFIEECTNSSTYTDTDIIKVNEEFIFENCSCYALLQDTLNIEFQCTTPTVPLSDVTTVLNNTESDIAAFLIQCSKTIGLIVKEEEELSDAKSCLFESDDLVNYFDLAFFTLLTIGYRTTTPKKPLGQLVLIGYALLGLPITLRILILFGKLISNTLTLLIKSIEQRFFKKKSSYKELSLKVLLHCMIVFLVLILCSCIVTSYGISDWDYSSSLYFWFVSYTTIGYGDLMLKRANTNVLYLLLTYILSIVALAFVYAIVQTCLQTFQKQNIVINLSSFNDYVNQIGSLKSFSNNEYNEPNGQHSDTSSDNKSSKKESDFMSVNQDLDMYDNNGNESVKSQSDSLQTLNFLEIDDATTSSEYESNSSIGGKNQNVTSPSLGEEFENINTNSSFRERSANNLNPNFGGKFVNSTSSSFNADYVNNQNPIFRGSFTNTTSSFSNNTYSLSENENESIESNDDFKSYKYFK